MIVDLVMETISISNSLDKDKKNDGISGDSTGSRADEAN
jgi:hypothetical protein